MNAKQRWILIIGAIVLAVLLATTPQYQMYNGNMFKANHFPTFKNQYDLMSMMLRIGIVLALSFGGYLFARSKDDSNK